MKEKKFVVVTTDKRGVFAGMVSWPARGPVLELQEAQMCVYWDASCRGVMGLAAKGPGKQCRVGPPVPAMIVEGVTAIMQATEEAEKAWKAQPWS